MYSHDKYVKSDPIHINKSVSMSKETLNTSKEAHASDQYYDGVPPARDRYDKYVM